MKYETSAANVSLTILAVLFLGTSALLAQQTQTNSNTVAAAQAATNNVVTNLDKTPVRIHAFISGKVQGVGFRAFTSSRAGLLNVKVTGWVRNLADGRVEIVVEGPKKDVEKFMSEVAKGPKGSRVDNVDRKEEPYTGKFSGFKIETTSD